MHDLRKKTLIESGKTVSRKARAKPETKSARSTPNVSPALTPPRSRPGSRFNSRPTSRVNTDDEADDSVDDDDVTSPFPESDDDDDHLLDKVRGLLAQMQNRKHSSVQGREDTLNAYIHLLRRHYLQPIIGDEIGGIISALRRSIRSGVSTRECLLAIKALGVTSVTFPSDRYFEDAYGILKALVQESEDEDIKAEATRALGILVSCPAVDSSASEDLLDFLVEIVESDGAQVEAHDSVTVVAAALRTWAFVAAQLVGDLSSHMEQAMETFTDQLDSTDPEVQASAGINIALLFESARVAKEEDSADEDDDENFDDGYVDASASFDFQYDRHKIVTRISEIMRDSSRLVSRKQKRDLRSTFTSILTSLERRKGPGYSTVRSREFSHLSDEFENALDSGIKQEKYEEGYRERFRVNQHVLVIDTWAIKVKLETLKAILGSGLGVHYCENPFAQTLLNGASEEVKQKVSKTWTSAMRAAARKVSK